MVGTCLPELGSAATCAGYRCESSDSPSLFSTHTEVVFEADVHDMTQFLRA